MQIPVRSIACCLASIASFSMPARAAVEATASGRTGFDLGGMVEAPVVQTTILQPQGGKLVTFAGSSETFDPSGLLLASGSSEGLAYAAPGLLRARLDTVAMAAVNPTNPTIPGIWGAQAIASVRAAFSDGLTITSSTLAIGTLVRYVATFSMDFVTNGPADGTGGFGYTATVDPRHTGVRTLDRSRSKLRLYNDWTMGYVHDVGVDEDIQRLGASTAPRQHDVDALMHRMRPDSLLGSLT